MKSNSLLVFTTVELHNFMSITVASISPARSYRDTHDIVDLDARGPFGSVDEQFREVDVEVAAALRDPAVACRSTVRKPAHHIKGGGKLLG